MTERRLTSRPAVALVSLAHLLLLTRSCPSGCCYTLHYLRARDSLSEAAVLSFILIRLHTLFDRTDLCPVSYLVLDGHFGNNNALQMVLQSTSLNLVSKLRNNAALYFVYDGPQKKSGPRRRYGDKIDYQAIPVKYRKAISQEGKIQTEIFQAAMLHKCFAQPLNVVVIVKTNLHSGARTHVVLFSNDLNLEHDKLIDYYQLRFQIEFNFRDAKQF